MGRAADGVELDVREPARRGAQRLWAFLGFAVSNRVNERCSVTVVTAAFISGTCGARARDNAFVRFQRGLRHNPHRIAACKDKEAVGVAT